MKFEEHRNRNVVLQGPYGVCFGIYESANDPAPHDFGAPFNAMQMARAIAPAPDFYADVLDWSLWFDGETRLTMNQFRMPANYKGKVPKKSARYACLAGRLRHGETGAMGSIQRPRFYRSGRATKPRTPRPAMAGG